MFVPPPALTNRLSQQLVVHSFTAKNRLNQILTIIFVVLLTLSLPCSPATT